MHPHHPRPGSGSSELFDTLEPRKLLATFTVTSDADSGAGSLRQAVIDANAAAGADVIELGMPFSDPMADGPAIQASGKRALDAGATMVKTLDLVRAFRAEDADTPIVLMGYLNPVERFGTGTWYPVYPDTP